MKCQKVMGLISLVCIASIISCSKKPNPQPSKEATFEINPDPFKGWKSRLTQDVLPIAIIGAQDMGNQKRPIAALILDELAYLLKQAQIPLVERQALQTIMEEQDLSASQFIDDTKAISIGHLVGARSLLLTRYAVLPNKILLYIRLVDSEKGNIIASEKTSIAITDHLAGLIKPENPAAQTPIVALRLLQEMPNHELKTMTAGDPIPSMSRLKMEFSIDRTLHVYLFSIDHDQNVQLLYPGVLSGLANPLTAGQYTLPTDENWIILDENPGREAFVLVGNPEPITDTTAITHAIKETIQAPPTPKELQKLNSLLAHQFSIIRAFHYLHQ